jgi:hypothetical protein
MLSNSTTFLAAEADFRRDRAQREIADAALSRRLRRARRSKARQAA